MKTIKKFYAWGTGGSFHLCKDERGLFLQWGGPRSEYARIRDVIDIASVLFNAKIDRNQYHFDSFNEAVTELHELMARSKKEALK